MFAALQLDLTVRITALREKQKSAQEGGDGSPAGATRQGPDPVLKAMGQGGLDRALLEYYKACAAKQPVYGQRAFMSYAPGSYIGQLYASLMSLLDPLVELFVCRKRKGGGRT